MKTASPNSVRFELLFLVVLWLAMPPTRALNGIEGTFEFACDAPWRIEPHRTTNGTIEYGAIPIQISIHDAKHAHLDNVMFVRGPTGPMALSLPKELVSLGKLQEVFIRELAPTQTLGRSYSLRSFYEIEATFDDWPSAPFAFPPTHRLCRLWNGDNPAGLENVQLTSEWHGALWYEPVNPVPGRTITLEVRIILQRDPWTAEDSRIPNPGRFITLRNYLRVHLAERPLPRFNANWIYGDFHYHSQGTDNEGEAAYNYRGVIRALGSMGLDFVFATDHASASEQLIDVDVKLDLLEEFFGSLFGDADPLEENDADKIGGVLRDMDARRYAFCHSLIYGTNGANRQASLRGKPGRWPQNYLSYGVVPQIFLGGELDVIPEARRADVGDPPPPRPQNPDAFELLEWRRAFEAWRPRPIPYGNDGTFPLTALVKPGKRAVANLFELVGDEYLIRDFQGVDSYHLYGREHLVYFPNSSALMVGNESSFVPSYTSDYGGATRRLAADHRGRAALLPEIERKGFAFIAHHYNGPLYGGSPGPDGIPWTVDHTLTKAFSSPAILGLQFWNENSRYRSPVCSHEFCRDDNLPGAERGYERDESFDVLGYEPEALKDKPMPLALVREGFITGGIEGSLFELQPFTIPDGKSDPNSFSLLTALHHGSYDWDQMNLKGLNLQWTSTLPWLPAGQPRKILMAGGSDAHGDLNYRRAGYFLGAEDANDTAIGRPRNLILVGPPEGPNLGSELPIGEISALQGSSIIRPPRPGEIRPHTQEQVIRAIKSGSYCVTDGPIIRIAIDINANHVIDGPDIPMGSVFEFKKMPPPRNPLLGGQKIAVLTECISTPEFGEISRIDLYLGAQPNPPAAGQTTPIEPRVYAAPNHGIPFPGFSYALDLIYQSQGRTYAKYSDNYWWDNRLTTGRLDSERTRQQVYQHTAVTILDLDTFEVGQGIRADRFFVRAFVRTTHDTWGGKPERFGFSNPIWISRSESLLNLPPQVTEPVARVLPTADVARTADGKVALTFMGVLQHTPDLNQAFQDVTGAQSPLLLTNPAPTGFYRSRE